MIDVIDGREYPREEPTGCPICGEHHPPRVFPGRFGMTVSIAECAGDRLAYQTPRPSLEASRAYMDMRWRSQDAYVADRDAQLERAQTQMKLLRDYPGRLLDFGAGTGTFVHVAQQAGWTTVGVEASREARARAREDHGVTLTEHLPDGFFDVITLWDVIEHVRDPQGLLDALFKRLAPEGTLFIETGNYESWQRLAAGDEWGLFLLDHQTYFTPHSLARMVQRAGFIDFGVLQETRRKPRGLQWVRHWRAWNRAALDWWPHNALEVMVAVVR